MKNTSPILILVLIAIFIFLFKEKKAKPVKKTVKKDPSNGHGIVSPKTVQDYVADPNNTKIPKKCKCKKEKNGIVNVVDFHPPALPIIPVKFPKKYKSVKDYVADPNNTRAPKIKQGSGFVKIKIRPRPGASREEYLKQYRNFVL